MRIGAIADRLIERLVPRVTVEAACVFNERICAWNGRSRCSDGREKHECVTYYDNCPSKSSTICR